jgi:hypothetical protein
MTKNGASGGIGVTNGGMVYYAMDGGFYGHSGPFNPKPEEDSSFAFAGGMRDPTCPTASVANTWPSSNGVRYSTIKDVDYYYYPSGLSKQNQNLQPGIHCVQGGIGKGDYVGDDVLIVLLSGGIKQTGNDSFTLRAATDLKDANGTQWGGMVLYAPYSNKSEINFGGNSKAYLQGVLYAPGAFCDIGGNPDQKAYHTAIVCDKIRFHGTPDVEILYNSAELFHFPPMVELVQ